MDYPLLNLFFGLGLIFIAAVNICLRILLSRVRLSVWQSRLSWIAVSLSILPALYIESLFLRLMTPAFNRQIGLGFLVIAAISVVLTAILYPRVEFGRIAGILVAAQILFGVASLVLAFGLYRSLVPTSPSSTQPVTWLVILLATQMLPRSPVTPALRCGSGPNNIKASVQ